MDVETISMPAKAAREKFLEYRRAVRERHQAEDAAIMRGYRELARGRKAINLRSVMTAAGVNGQGFPALAVMRADHAFCYVSSSHDGRWVNFFYRIGWPRGNAGLGRLPRRFRFEGIIRSGMRISIWDGWRSPVPVIPPGLRPKAGLRNYHVLWEVERWEKSTVAPRDPLLLNAWAAISTRSSRDGI
jgi:hypothetical protein